MESVVIRPRRLGWESMEFVVMRRSGPITLHGICSHDAERGRFSTWNL